MLNIIPCHNLPFDILFLYDVRGKNLIETYSASGLIFSSPGAFVCPDDVIHMYAPNVSIPHMLSLFERCHCFKIHIVGAPLIEEFSSLIRARITVFSRELSF